MRHTVLVVDDDKSLQVHLRSVLEKKGFRVLSALDAEEGLKVLSAENVDVALLDIWMPGMNGLEMLERLRQRNLAVQVIVMSGAGTQETALSALRARAFDFLVKPFSPQDLLSAVQAALDFHKKGGIEVLSARPEWIELRIACHLSAVEPLERIMVQLTAALPADARENMAFAFREMLRNAIEHGGKNDPERYVQVACLRTPRLILYRIKDPGEGFSPELLPHAALAENVDPIQHQRVRENLGLRPGGLGILLTRMMVDEMIYNQCHNEVVLIRYLDSKH
ncbi:MAG TPA: response regulator [Acidobacteriota bacterium]|jgi:DNA-binding response OmpR family regulator